MKKEDEIIFGKGVVNPFGKYFVGQSYLNILSNKLGITVANVTFEEGCRNNWHIHKASKGGGQILLVTNGEGWYQEEGRLPQKLHVGDVVTIPANVKHWHGAAFDSCFSHISIEVPGKDTKTEWLETVTDEEYRKLEE